MSTGQARALPSADRLANAQTLVIKIGSALLIDPQSNEINRPWLNSLAADVAALHGQGKNVLIVSSGAIGLGRRLLGLPPGPLRLEESQAAAAAGQIDLAHAYREMLGERDIITAQILITLSDTEERRRYLNARDTVQTLFRNRAVPVVNENDTVATTEIRYGDNDRLAARVAAMASADSLVLLSDIDGLYTADPRRDPAARFLPEVREVTPEIEAMAAPVALKTAAQMGSGGMVTKLAAAKICLGAGCDLAIMDGRALSPLSRLKAGAQATWFLADRNPKAARKTWIASSLAPRGALTIDDGAVAALKRGKSLLPAGVLAVEGLFERGDAVIVRTSAGVEIARGLVAYSAADAAKISGHKTREIEDLLGYRGRSEMIHRDDLTLA